MKKQTTMKWFSGIFAAVTAASFIGFVQSTPPNVNDGSNGEVTNYSQSDDGDQTVSDNNNGYYHEDHGDEYDYESNDSGSFRQGQRESDQGFQPSERRTRHS